MSADMDNVLDLFYTDDFNDNDEDIPKNENYYAAEILKLMKETNDFPLYIYVMIKTLLRKKDLLNEIQIQEISQILNIKPIVKEKIIVKPILELCMVKDIY